VLTIHEKQGAGSPIRWASFDLFKPEFDELGQKNQEGHRCGRASAGLSSAWEGSELGQFVTFSGWVSATNWQSFGGNWSGLGLGIGSQLVAVGWVNGSPVGRDLPPVGAVGWWFGGRLLWR